MDNNGSVASPKEVDKPILLNNYIIQKIWKNQVVQYSN